jgi:hypothetical protein
VSLTLKGTYWDGTGSRRRSLPVPEPPDRARVAGQRLWQRPLRCPPTEMPSNVACSLTEASVCGPGAGVGRCPGSGWFVSAVLSVGACLISADNGKNRESTLVQDCLSAGGTAASKNHCMKQAACSCQIARMWQSLTTRIDSGNVARTNSRSPGSQGAGIASRLEFKEEAMAGGTTCSAVKCLRPVMHLPQTVPPVQRWSRYRVPTDARSAGVQLSMCRRSK